MIKIIDGNILNSKADLILHQVNCCGKINSGVTKTLRNFNEGILQHYYFNGVCNLYVTATTNMFHEAMKGVDKLEIKGIDVSSNQGKTG